MKALIIIVFSFNLIFSNAFDMKDLGETISKLSSELGISEPMQSDDSNVEICPEKCSKQINELKKNLTDLYMTFLTLHAEFSHMTQHILAHEKALKHIAYWAHKPSRNVSESQRHDQHQSQDESNKCVKCNKHYADDDDEEEGEHRFRNHRHHNHNVQPNQSSDSVTTQKSKSDEQNDEKKDNESSEESKDSSEEKGVKGVTKSSGTMKSSNVHNSYLNQNNIIQSSDWFEKMLNDIHNRSHKNHNHMDVSHSIHTHKGIKTNTSEQNLEEMEKSLTSEDLIFATCEIRPNRHIALLNQQDISGRINMWQKISNKGPLHMHLKLKGFKVNHLDHKHHARQVRDTILMPMETKPDEQHSHNLISGHTHGFHVHEYGDLSRDCQSTGSHYNPINSLHGGPYDDVKHVGDLGNIRCDQNGETDVEISFSHVSLLGEQNIINRSLVIHNNADDYGRNPENPSSLTTGSSGIRIACCVIEEVKVLPKEDDSQSIVGAVAAPVRSNKKRRETNYDFRKMHYKPNFENEYMSEVYKKIYKHENDRKYQTLFERLWRKNLKFNTE